MPEEAAASRRFLVALSFPGEKREFVRAVAEHLGKAVGQERVFYDEWYKPELARKNLDLRLQKIYRDETHLVVPFFCDEYDKKK